MTEDSKKGNATPRLLVRRLRRLSFITPLGSGRVAQSARPVLGAEGSDQQTADSQRPPEACGAQWAQCQSQPKPKSSTGLQKVENPNVREFWMRGCPASSVLLAGRGVLLARSGVLLAFLISNVFFLVSGVLSFCHSFDAPVWWDFGLALGPKSLASCGSGLNVQSLWLNVLLGEPNV